MSEQILARRIKAEAGIGLHSRRQRLRLFEAIKLLGSGLDVNRTAMELGYRPTPAFV